MLEVSTTTIQESNNILLSLLHKMYKRACETSHLDDTSTRIAAISEYAHEKLGYFQKHRDELIAKWAHKEPNSNIY